MKISWLSLQRCIILYELVIYLRQYCKNYNSLKIIIFIRIIILPVYYIVQQSSFITKIRSPLKSEILHVWNILFRSLLVAFSPKKIWRKMSISYHVIINSITRWIFSYKIAVKILSESKIIQSHKYWVISEFSFGAMSIKNNINNTTCIRCHW